jgi:hypothetical protein
MKESVVHLCPHCKTNSVLYQVAVHEEHGIWQCVTCKNATYLRIRFAEGGADWEVLAQHPSAPEDPPASVVPKAVLDDYREARKCLEVGAPKACVSMCRRTLSTSSKERGAKDGYLLDQLGELRQAGLISQELLDWAGSIDSLAYRGRNLHDHMPSTATNEEAEEVLSYLHYFLHFLYVIPAQMERQRRARPVRRHDRAPAEKPAETSREPFAFQEIFRQDRNGK